MCFILDIRDNGWDSIMLKSTQEIYGAMFYHHHHKYKATSPCPECRCIGGVGGAGVM